MFKTRLTVFSLGLFLAMSYILIPVNIHKSDVFENRMVIMVSHHNYHTVTMWPPFPKFLDSYYRYLYINDGPYRHAYSCPDTSIQVVAFAPNNLPIELQVTKDVAQTATDLGFKTKLLLVENATRANFLSYAQCPKLIALFYDGDANNDVITAHDKVISHYDIAALNWNYRVTTYWLACQAFNSPMLDAVTAAKPRRWAAGRSDLGVGASDQAAAWAMKQALNGSCLEESFDKGIQEYDKNPLDFWGFGGYGPNILVDSLIYPIPCGGME